MFLGSSLLFGFGWVLMFLGSSLLFGFGWVLMFFMIFFIVWVWVGLNGFYSGMFLEKIVLSPQYKGKLLLWVLKVCGGFKKNFYSSYESLYID